MLEVFVLKLRLMSIFRDYQGYVCLQTECKPVTVRLTCNARCMCTALIKYVHQIFYYGLGTLGLGNINNKDNLDHVSDNS